MGKCGWLYKCPSGRCATGAWACGAADWITDGTDAVGETYDRAEAAVDEFADDAAKEAERVVRSNVVGDFVWQQTEDLNDAAVELRNDLGLIGDSIAAAPSVAWTIYKTDQTRRTSLGLATGEYMATSVGIMEEGEGLFEDPGQAILVNSGLVDPAAEAAAQEQRDEAAAAAISEAAEKLQALVKEIIPSARQYVKTAAKWSQKRNEILSYINDIKRDVGANTDAIGQFEIAVDMAKKDISSGAVQSASDRYGKTQTGASITKGMYYHSSVMDAIYGYKMESAPGFDDVSSRYWDSPEAWTVFGEALPDYNAGTYDGNPAPFGNYPHYWLTNIISAVAQLDAVTDSMTPYGIPLEAPEIDNSKPLTVPASSTAPYHGSFSEVHVLALTTKSGENNSGFNGIINSVLGGAGAVTTSEYSVGVSQACVISWNMVPSIGSVLLHGSGNNTHTYGNPEETVDMSHQDSHYAIGWSPGMWSAATRIQRIRRNGLKFQEFYGSTSLGGKLKRNLYAIANSLSQIEKSLRMTALEIMVAYFNYREEICKIALEFNEAAADAGYDLLGMNFMTDAQAEEALRNLNIASEIENQQFDISRTFYGEEQKTVLFREQCFLLSFIGDIAAVKKTRDTRFRDGSGLNDSEVMETFYSKSSKRLPYVHTENNTHPKKANASILLDGESYGFLNKLTQNPKLKHLFDIHNHELSNLQPHIRLWKVEFDDEGNEKDVEIQFETHFSAQEYQYFKNNQTRGVGVGLKSFNFTYDGSNPFAVKKSIKANLKIFANTFSELIRERDSYNLSLNDNDELVMSSTKYRYTDLAMKTWNTADKTDQRDLTTENVKNAELNFRLKAQIGLALPPGEMNSLSKDTRDALKEAYTTLNLTPTVHNFEFDETGRVVFNINYLAYIEEFFDQNHFNVFSDKEMTINRYRREFKMNEHHQRCSQEQINQQKKDYADSVDSEQSIAISSLMAEMMNPNNDMIYYINLPYSSISKFLMRGPFQDYSDLVPKNANGNSLLVTNNAGQNAILKNQIGEAMDVAFAKETIEGQLETMGSEAKVSERDENRIAAALLSNNPNNTSLSFFYLSDLIDTILYKIGAELSSLEDDIAALIHESGINSDDVEARQAELRKAKTAFESFRLVMGPVEFTHPNKGKSLFVNFGDIPISVKYFVEWLANKMLSKDEVFYPLTRFLNDVMNDLVHNFLNNESCFGYSVKQKTRVNQATVSGWSASERYDGLTEKILRSARGEQFDFKKETIQEEGTTTIKNAKAIQFRSSVDSYSLPILDPSGPSNSELTSLPAQNCYNYFVYFAGRTMPTELMKGNKDEDHERGIFHYILGRDKGLVKNIKLTKTQTKGLAEVRFEQEGYDGLEQLRVIYDAQVDMFAHVNTFPGTYIYIEPRGFSPDLEVVSDDGEYTLSKLGIGGYYMIVRSEHEFGPGTANTILHTKWVNQIDKDVDEEDREQYTESTTGDGGKTTRRCAIKLRENANETGDLSTIGGGFLSG